MELEKMATNPTSTNIRANYNRIRHVHDQAEEQVMVKCQEML